MKELYTFGPNGDLLAEFNRQGVRFLLVGGLAVQFYAPDRKADDLDILIEPVAANADRVLDAFRALNLLIGFPKKALCEPPKKQVPLKTLHYADVLTDPALDFQTEWERASAGTVNGHPVRIASRDLLLQMKQSDRPRDVADTELLRGAIEP